MRKVKKSLGLLTVMFAVLLCLSCGNKQKSAAADRLNSMSYACHYRDLKLTRQYALQALDSARAAGYNAGIAEAYNNLAFVSIAKMNYTRAEEFLRYAISVSDNLLEQLVANVQMMRLCQRQSSNKDFYSYMQSARQMLARIADESYVLDAHEWERYVYAHSEFHIVASTYFYYIGMLDYGVTAIEEIDPNGSIVKDTAQLLNYYYNIGSGGILRGMPREEVRQREFDYLMRCYLLSRQYGYPYWEANSLQGLSEHMQDKSDLQMLKRSNMQEIEFVNVDNMADSLLAGNLATRSLRLFRQYGDVYQTAGAYRTLAQCYWHIGDYLSAEVCLNHALSDNPRVKRAPDLIASIREQLSLVYSAMDMKPLSDYNRNIYLDMQEFTRQDRLLEARADVLDRQALQLNVMIVAICLIVVVMSVLLWWLNYKRRHGRYSVSQDTLLAPLREWKGERERELEQFEDSIEQKQEEIAVASMQLQDNKRLNIEQRAKVSLANSIMPLINRIVSEADKLVACSESQEVRQTRYGYMLELAEKIDEYNDALTQWIKMRRGDLTVKVESFPLQQLFDVIAGRRMEFSLKGVDFKIEPTADVVKADKTLTLFMLNTLADNARKHTPEDGHVTIGSKAVDGYVEISITDDGDGMTAEQVANLFCNKIIVDESLTGNHKPPKSEHVSHGFGLMNCKGIIEKYKKLSSIFSVCAIGAESQEGCGSRFYFRLPKGVVRTLMVLAMFVFMPSVGNASVKQDSTSYMSRAGAFADSVYFCNLNARHREALAYADSCRHWLNAYYLSLHPQGRLLLRKYGDARRAAEFKWFRSGFKCNYSIVLDMRNESAVAALALHDWDAYEYNNKVYTQLFRLCSADNTLADYVEVMKRSETNKNVAIVLLTVLLVLMFPAYYLVYYRYRLRYRNAVEKVSAINGVLLGDNSSEDKYAQIVRLWGDRRDKTHDSGPMQELASVVKEIEQTLLQEIDNDNGRLGQESLLDDELQRLQYERDRLHVSNSVLDNCLSTLKHETMYYPSRITCLVDTPEPDVKAVRELAYYYRELFALLCEQAMRQMAAGARMDYSLLGYVKELISRMASVPKLDFAERDMGNGYVCLTASVEGLRLSEKQLVDLFTPATVDFRLLVCRQILREYGELTNARGCGIQAFIEEGGGTRFEITVTKKIWKNSKS